jgi:hypothetical protein
MTILYNIQTQQVLGYYPDGYLVNGKPASPNDEDVLELTVVGTSEPTITEFQKLSDTWEANLAELTWTQVWVVINKTAYEIAMEDWAEPEYAKRIIAPMQLVMDDVGSKMYNWFSINDFPIVRKEPLVHVYCNTILAEHQSVIDAFAGMITIEDRPTE